MASVYYPVPTPVETTAEEEIALLREQSQAVQDQLNQINERIAELRAEQGKE